MNKNITLNGGKNITVNFEPQADGSPAAAAEVKVRQIPVRDYERGFVLVSDEVALAGFLCGKDKAWALTLAPESFEEVLATGREVNERGFFSHCQRLTERTEKQNAAMIGVMATLPPETMKLAIEMGMAKQQASHSPTLSPAFVSPPVR
jgi:hypothetical protein